MKLLASLLALLFMLPANTDAQSLNDYRWKSRLLLVFTPSPDDSLFNQQYCLLQEAKADLAERKLQLLLLTPQATTTELPFLSAPANKEYYQQFQVPANAFTVILIGLDGGEKRRITNQVFQPQDLFATIDGMPMRRQEVQRKNRLKSQIDGRK